MVESRMVQWFAGQTLLLIIIILILQHVETKNKTKSENKKMYIAMPDELQEVQYIYTIRNVMVQLTLF